MKTSTMILMMNEGMTTMQYVTLDTLKCKIGHTNMYTGTN